MKAITWLGFLAIGVMGMNSARAQSSQVVIDTTTYVSGQTQTVSALLAIETVTGASVTVLSGANITYSAGGTVVLHAGFHAASGAVFHAAVTIDSDGDGMPDDWESAHGLNPNNAGDAANTAPNGLSYLTIYQLGLEPLHASQPDSSNQQTELKLMTPP